MVLSDSSGFGDDAPPSDGDSYEQNATTYYQIPANIPRSPWVSEARLQQTIFKARQAHAQTVERPLTAEEADFSAYYAAKMLAIQSWGAPIGIAGGLYRAYATRSTMKFPFVGLDNKMFYDTLPKNPLLKNLLHLGRTSLYVGLWGMVGQLLMTSYSLTSAMVGASADPRGKGILEALNEKRAAHRPRRPVPVPRQGEEGEAQPYASDTMPVNESGVGTSTVDAFQEASPTSGYNTPTAGFDAPFNEGIAKPAGSAWERVRQQAGSGKPSTSAWRKPEPPGGSVGDESFGSSKSDDDIQSARERAQKEFDERVEKERHGGSFDSSKGDTNRW